MSVVAHNTPVPPAQGFELNGAQDTLSHCMKDYKHGPNSRMSITFNSSKGLTNAPGQNNCFLNSAVQVLWHLDAFRRSFRLLSGHSCMGNSCIFCALKVMFTQFQYSDKQVLPPDALRQALSETFHNQQRFQMGFMDDAAECFENILTRIHSHIASEESEDTCTSPHCIPHRKFSMSVSEQVVCGSCGSKSEPFTFNEMVFYVSTGALVTEFKSHSSEELSKLSFSQLLKSTVSKGDVRACPDNCGAFGEKRRDLNNIPDVVSIGLVWESAKSGSQHIRDVVNCIGKTLNLDEMFHSTPHDSSQGGNGRTQSQPLQLVGVVCYYGKHYSTFFFHSKVHEWIYFDDASVKQISPNWTKVCEKLCKGRHQPLLLLYMNPNTEAVDVTSAPKFRTMAQGYEWKSEEHNEPISTKSKTPVPDMSTYSKQAPSRRAYTPAPDKLDARYDEVDAAYAARHFYSDRERHPGGGHTDREMSTALSRQDSGVSTHSSWSQQAAESDSVSGISTALTQHSSDSGSSGHQLSRQESDTASSYCSRSSRASTLSTISSAVESEDTGYAGLHPAYQKEILAEQKTDKPKISLKKKKMRNRLSADVVRYHSKSQASLLDVHNQSYDDSSLTRENHHDIDVTDQKSFSYATLPRKKRATPATQQPQVTAVKSPETGNMQHATDGDNYQHTRGYENGSEETAPYEDDKTKPETPPRPSVNSRIQMFNGINGQTKVSGELNDQSTSSKRSNDQSASSKRSNDQSASSKSNQSSKHVANGKPPELKALLHITNSGKDGESSTYISRSNVEKIMIQQRKASSTRNGTKMVRPTYDEQFVVPEEYSKEAYNGRRHDMKLDITAAAASASDNTSISSLKDSGYRSLGDRGSNSASSVSSLSVESPTMNNSFTFDTREPIYCEPPPIASEYENANVETADDVQDELAEYEYDFPPPPPELMGNSNHTKQLSEASLLSEASTVKHRKTPSVESLDALPTLPGDPPPPRLSNGVLPDVTDSLSNMSINDGKLKSLLRSAEDFIDKSLDREEKKEMSTSLAFCRQAASLLNSAQSQQSEDRQLMFLVQSKHEYCVNRAQQLLSRIVNDKEREAEDIPNNGPSSRRHVMGELHIDNQTRREAASSDYTPLHNALRRAPAKDVNKSHRLSRTDSQISSSSNGSSTTHTMTSTSHRSLNSPRTTSNGDVSDARTIHTIPPQLQHSISQLQQRQQPHPPQRQNSQPTPVQYSQQSQKQTPQHSAYIEQQSHPQQPQQNLNNQKKAYSRQSSNGSMHSNTESRTVSTVPKQAATHTLYREVTIPTTLQRNDYIRDGYRPVPTDRKSCASPSVIPPPKEFQESSSSRNSPVPILACASNNVNSQRGNYGYQASVPSKPTYSMYGSQTNNSANKVSPPYPTKTHTYNHTSQPTQSPPVEIQGYNQPQHGQLPQYSRTTSAPTTAVHNGDLGLPPKQNINKQGIRNLLVQDMLKRKGQPPEHKGQGQPPEVASNNISHQSHGLQSYGGQYEEPLWTPPQKSAFDRGLSHYDRPNYQRQNLYGQVHSQPTVNNNRYPASSSQPQHSLYGENISADVRRGGRPSGGHESRINHCHTYSTEL